MAWRVELSQTARKQFAKLDAPVKRAAAALFDRLSRLDDPRDSGHALTGPLRGYWTYRVHGDWRAVVQIHDQVITIEVMKIARRDSVYG